jgi:hypothetical protein
MCLICVFFLNGKFVVESQKNLYYGPISQKASGRIFSNFAILENPHDREPALSILRDTCMYQINNPVIPA